MFASRRQSERSTWLLPLQLPMRVSPLLVVPDGLVRNHVASSRLAYPLSGHTTPSSRQSARMFPAKGRDYGAASPALGPSMTRAGGPGTPLTKSYGFGRGRGVGLRRERVWSGACSAPRALSPGLMAHVCRLRSRDCLPGKYARDLTSDEGECGVDGQPPAVSLGCGLPVQAKTGREPPFPRWATSVLVLWHDCQTERA
ncbi:uncharacterized protein LY79DRAFT_324412 [Colletotrichum navitas]|uniref:Uncharacterized protein n=1 Tax=Colletotrichum navitas TaxID=681940 RepID=A0AAD8V894_9PEZI|nr:uncharacterized protein LY79DRAFT_324412 [Colletotrichum navitas]KAK1597977.1 hypothetical protein LY79DRAFT_324412 [Colletotrichum navitas]